MTKTVGGFASTWCISRSAKKTKRKKLAWKAMKHKDTLGNSETQTYTDSHRVARVKRNRTHANPCCDTRLHGSETQATGSKEKEREDAEL